MRSSILLIVFIVSGCGTGNGTGSTVITPSNPTSLMLPVPTASTALIVESVCSPDSGFALRNNTETLIQDASYILILTDLTRTQNRFRLAARQQMFIPLSDGADIEVTYSTIDGEQTITMSQFCPPPTPIYSRTRTLTPAP